MSRSDYDISHQTWNHDRPAPTLRWPRIRCHECKREIFSEGGTRELELDGKVIRICWACVDDILTEALR